MHELNPDPGFLVHTAALDAAIRGTLASKFVGVSTYGPSRSISLWMDDSAAPADDTTATGLAASHDPVFLSVDKANIQADNTDTATVTVSAPNPSAAPVTLLVNGTAVPVTLSAGTGTIQITSPDPQTITVSVQSPANRSTDQLSIKAG